ncbi:S-layer homology domain-containing protein [Geomicrobium sediminis]|uniref:SLH domain-containing protein n=1 Tax=Geomicrobium sediminis TaxID=1347788 RepID=A0ABS2P7K2_9BACL|nr:S-layer homology domain-containing protein [Geomicrobium sediminis]MBM7631398.1 hypothetical protein [Geomicrobium sediminis]
MAYQPKSYRKFIAGTMTAAMAASAFAVTTPQQVVNAEEQEQAFSDVSPSYYAYEEIQRAYERGLINGHTDGTYRPGVELIRGQAARMIANALEMEIPEVTEDPFTDLSADNVFAGVAKALNDAGIIVGRHGGTEFGANLVLTREQMATILVRAFELEPIEGAETNLTDLDKAYHAHTDNIEIITQHGISYVESGVFKPQDPVNRVQMAVFLDRAVDVRNTLDSGIAGLSATDNQTVDVTYYEEVEEVSAEQFEFPGLEVLDANIIEGEDGENNVVRLVTEPQTADEVYRLHYEGERTSLTFVGSDVDAEAPVEVTSVRAINENTVRVNFNQQINNVDFNNFTVSDRTVTNTEISEDGDYVDVTVNRAFTRNQEYTINSRNIVPAQFEDEPRNFENTFTWVVTEGTTVSLESTSLIEGDESKLNVVDQNGNAVSGSTAVELTSSNTNVVSTTGQSTLSDAKVTAINAGTAQVTAKVTLADGSVLRNTFTVTVDEKVEEIENRGFTLVSDIANAPDNTVAFENSYHVTDLVHGDSASVAMFDVTDGDPNDAPLSFAGATVRSLNSTLASASINGNELVLTANDAGRTGEAKFEVTFDDDTQRTVTIDVVDASKFNDIGVNTTSINLSGDTRGSATYVEGVNSQEVTISALDQYDTWFNSFGSEGKIVISSDTEGLYVNGDDDSVEVLNSDITGGDYTFDVQAGENEDLSGTVKVNYFAKASDDAPTSTHNIAVNVADVDITDTEQSLDVVAPSAIDALATANVGNFVNSIDFDNEDEARVYVLNDEGNRIGLSSPVEITSSNVNDNEWLSDVPETGGTTLSFFDTDEARTFLTDSGSVNVDVEADGITQTLSIDYLNSANNPASASRVSSTAAIKLADADTSITFEEILFGKPDEEQLVLDRTPLALPDNYAIAVANAASNGGYQYNKPVLSFKNQAGEDLATGVNVYGFDPTSVSGNTWNINALNDSFTQDNFDVDFTVTNVNPTSVTVPNTGDLSDGVTLSAGDAVTFTIVIEGVYVNGYEALPIDNEVLNLLDDAVTVEVSISK